MNEFSLCDVLTMSHHERAVFVFLLSTHLSFNISASFGFVKRGILFMAWPWLWFYFLSTLRCYYYCHSTREMIFMVMNGYELWVCMPLATYNVGFGPV